MKSSKQIKKELHEYIDRIDDEETLWIVHEEVGEYLKKDKVKLEDNTEEVLTEEEISEINTGLQQVKKGELVDWDEYLKATSRWQTK